MPPENMSHHRRENSIAKDGRLNTYVISVMATNDVGIVAAVSTAVDELGGNIVELSQTVMRGFFTILLAAEFPSDRGPEEVTEHIADVGSRFKLHVTLQKADEAVPSGEQPRKSERFLLTVTGDDRPGIIRQIASLLAGQQIDIEDLYAAGSAGAFRMILELDVPPGVDTRALARQLEQQGRTIGLSAHLVHENIFVATNELRPVRLGFAAKKIPSTHTTEDPEEQTASSKKRENN